MNNKKVIRKDLKPNGFTSIHNSILNDKRLSSNAFRLISSILSDNDDNFKLSQTTYCNRLGWESTMFKRAIENLMECGYIKRTLIDDDKVIPGIKKAGSKKKVYFYVVSEYGNLKQDEPISKEETPKLKKEVIKPTTPTIEKETIINDNNSKIGKDTLYSIYVTLLEIINEGKMLFIPSTFDRAFKPEYDFQGMTNINLILKNIDTFESFCDAMNQFEPKIVIINKYTGPELMGYVKNKCELSKGSLKNEPIRKAFIDECNKFFNSRKEQTFTQSDIDNKIAAMKQSYVETIISQD